MGSSVKTDFLFASPSFLSGVARLVDLGGQFDSYNESRTDEEADTLAMASDWNMVGDDIRGAIAEFETQHGL